MDERDKEMMSQQSNDFLARVGLDSDPFPVEADPSFYYENPDLMQRLDMIQHLIGFSNQMIFVTGDEGVGKTSMLDRLEYYAPDHWRICRIQANPMLNTPVLLRQLTSGFDIEISTETDDMFQIYSDALQSHIETLERAMLTPVVLIDNAHELPIDAFTMLFGFMQQEGGHSRMKMALFCEPQITPMLESPQLKTLAHNLTHQLEIPAFDQKQTGEYLEQRLHHAGLSGDFPFSPEAILKIHKESDGVAGKIHTLAQQLLLNEDAKFAPDSEMGADTEFIDDSESVPVVDEILEFDTEEDETSLLTTAANPKAEKNKPMGRKFHSWQIGAVAAVLALLTGVLWITSQFKNEPESSIAEEIPLDISQGANDLAQGSSEQEISQHDTNLFEESVSTDDLDVEEPEFDLTVLDPNIDKGIAPVEENNLENQVAEEVAAIEEVVEPLTTIEAGEENTDPLDDFVQAIENDQHEHEGGEGDHEHTEVTVKFDESGKAQIVEVEQQEVVVAELVEPKKVEQTIEEPASVEQVAKAIIEPVPIAEPVKQDVSTPKPAVKTTNNEPSIAGVKGEAWLRIQKDSEVLLQILGTHDQQALAKILTQNTMGNDVAWFTTVHVGEPWYVLVKGPYKNRAIATTSIASLPEAIKKRKPWPRTVASVKKAMDEAQ